MRCLAVAFLCSWIGTLSVVGVRAQTPVVVKPLVHVSQKVGLSVYEETLEFLHDQADAGPDMESGNPISVSMTTLYSSFSESVYFGNMYVLDPNSWIPTAGYQFIVRRSHLSGSPAAGTNTFYYRVLDSQYLTQQTPHQPSFTGAVELQFMITGLHLAVKSVPSPVLDYFRDDFRVTSLWVISQPSLGLDAALTMGFVCEPVNPLMWAPPEVVLLYGDSVGGQIVNVHFGP